MVFFITHKNHIAGGIFQTRNLFCKNLIIPFVKSKGSIVEASGILKFEGSISRTKIIGLTGKGLKTGMMATKSD